MLSVTKHLLLLAPLIALGIFTLAFEDSAPTRVMIKWSTRREINTAGYLIYRAENSAGPFVPITRDHIPAANDPYLGGNYFFTDTATLDGVTYFYQLEDIARDGTRTRHDPIAITARAATPTILGQPMMVIARALIAIALIVLTGRWIWHAR